MHFPMFVDLSQKNILVVGAGRIAARRIETLILFASNITVCATSVSKRVQELSADHSIRIMKQPFEENMLSGRELVLAATDSSELNQRIADLCRRQGIWVNSSSCMEDCDFYFPSVVQKGDVVIGINASGKNHALVKQTRQELEEYWGL